MRMIPRAGGDPPPPVCGRWYRVRLITAGQNGNFRLSEVEHVKQAEQTCTGSSLGRRLRLMWAPSAKIGLRSREGEKIRGWPPYLLTRERAPPFLLSARRIPNRVHE